MSSDPITSQLDIYPRELICYIPMFKDIHSYNVQNSAPKESQLSINRMVRLWYTHMTEYYTANKNKITSICKNTAGTQKHNVEQKKTLKNSV